MKHCVCTVEEGGRRLYRASVSYIEDRKLYYMHGRWRSNSRISKVDATTVQHSVT